MRRYCLSASKEHSVSASSSVPVIRRGVLVAALHSFAFQREYVTATGEKDLRIRTLGDTQRAAPALGIGRSTLYRKLKEFESPSPGYQVKILDFGLAHLGDATQITKTRARLLMRKPTRGRLSTQRPV